MRFEVEVRDLSAAVRAAIARAAKDGALKGAEKVVEKAQKRITEGTKSGNTYTKNGKTWQASAPGESPANVEGDLAEGNVARSEGDHAEAVSTDWKAHTMEFGTPRGKVKARPYMGKAAEESHADVTEAIADAIKAAL